MITPDLFGEQAAGTIRRSAKFSDNRKYRYTLERYWSDETPVLFVLLNPSTADATHDDPTNRRGMAFARSWGLGGCVFVNLFAFRTPFPKVLLREREEGVDIVGPLNMAMIAEMAGAAGAVVCAWGNHGRLNGQDNLVVNMLNDMWTPLFHMGLTKHGCPKHILYLPGTTELTPYNS